MRRLHRKNWALVLTVIVGGAALAAIPEAAAAAAGDTCLGGGPLVLNVSADYRNAAGFAADHHIWAIDSLDYLGFEATFAGGPCGVWRQSIDGSTGDIVC